MYIPISGTGNITPDTPSGRWFCLTYVLLGIPILSLFFGMTGYYLTQLLRLSIHKVIFNYIKSSKFVFEVEA